MGTIRVCAELVPQATRLYALLCTRFPDREIDVADFPANRLPTYVRGWSIGASISRENEPPYFIDFHPEEILEPGFEWKLDKRLETMPVPPERFPATLLGKPVVINNALSDWVKDITFGVYSWRAELEIKPDPNNPERFIGRVKRDAAE